MEKEEILQLIKDTIRTELDQLSGDDRFVFRRNLEIENGNDIEVGRRYGTKVGTSVTEKLGFYGVTPVVQQDNSATAGAFSAESGTAVLAGSTFSGYTIGEIVTILQTLGFIA